MDIKIQAKYLPIIAPFMARNDHRRNLTGICIQPHPQQGVYIVATNGTIIGAVHDAEGHADEEVIYRPGAGVLKACAKRPNPARRDYSCAGFLHLKDEAAYVTSNAYDGEDPAVIGREHLAVSFAECLQGPYPSWQRIFKPAAGPRATLSINITYLTMLQKAIEAGSRIAPCVVLEPTPNEDGLIFAKVAGLPEFYAAIMPMRTFDVVAGRPSWLGIPDSTKDDSGPDTLDDAEEKRA